MTATCDDPKSMPTDAAKFECYLESLHDWRYFSRDCRRRCPPPKPASKPPSKPKPKPAAKRPSKTSQTPPPLPPNPYDALAIECTNCATVGGKCCYGNRSPGHLCACANPSVACGVYGCD